jgi:hypothetical protein
VTLPIPKGRQPLKQVALHPDLVNALRYIARREGRKISDVFREMLRAWLRRRPDEYADVRKELKIDD